MQLSRFVLYSTVDNHLLCLHLCSQSATRLFVVPLVQSRSQAGSEQEPKASSYFGDSKDKMEDLPALPKADNAAGMLISTDREATRAKCQLICTIQSISQTSAPYCTSSHSLDLMSAVISGF